MTALLIGQAPPVELGYRYVTSPPYDTVVIGSMTLGQLLCFQNEQVLSALAQGIPVLLYTPGLPAAEKNRALSAALASRKREMKSWGIAFTDGSTKKLITAEAARQMKQQGIRPGPGAVLTPLAREILEGTT